DVGRPVGNLDQPLRVGLVLGEEQLARALGVQEPLAEFRMRDPDDAGCGLTERGARGASAPRPQVAEPERRQQMERRRLGPAVVEADEPLLEDRVLAVPDGDGEAEELLIVRDSCEPVLAPAVRPRARVVVAEVVPGVAGFAVVLADRPPLAFAEVGAPLLPRE